MVITTHFIDSEQKLQTIILNFYTVPDHKGETIEKVIESYLLEQGIDKVFITARQNILFDPTRPDPI